MTALKRLSEAIAGPCRCRARVRRVRPLVWAVFWASLAQVSWLSFKLAQVRIQPDAVATGVPGFLYRLVILPLAWAAEMVGAPQSGAPGLQPVLAAAISALAIGLLWQAASGLGRGGAAVRSATGRTLPGRRETTWN